MSTPAPTASGDRSVAVGGDIVGSVIVTGDNVSINVGAGGIGGTLLDLLGRRRVEKRARPRPLDVRPAPFDDRLDREEEVAALVTGDAGRLSVVGEALVGKTYVVRAALAEAAAHPSADGIVCLRGRGQHVRGPPAGALGGALRDTSADQAVGPRAARRPCRARGTLRRRRRGARARRRPGACRFVASLPAHPRLARTPAVGRNRAVDCRAFARRFTRHARARSRPSAGRRRAGSGGGAVPGRRRASAAAASGGGHRRARCADARTARGVVERY